MASKPSNASNRPEWMIMELFYMGPTEVLQAIYVYSLWNGDLIFSSLRNDKWQCEHKEEPPVLRE
ncbi:hypothetical protein Ddye_003587 [Dipteronia dyeriana]|uniref:Uncharacterized protein n=1 Tax=Dipteronia dyeriana TaxID=168575 RepID=A0AAD9XT96_9ROSI|nr:hypothetical protein Ddye_003587 [Dipteronia dyeriana]